MSELITSPIEKDRSQKWPRLLRHILGKSALGEVMSTSTPENPATIEALCQGHRLKEPVYMDIPVGGRVGTPIATVEEVVHLPVANFVSAPEFTDWESGRRDGRKNGKASSDVIKKYATLPGETAAPISMALAIKQPNGLVVYELVGDGAHRLAAAKKRHATKGTDEYIAVMNGVSLYDVDTNYIDI